MAEKEIIVLAKKGLQARAASRLVKKAMSFQSHIRIIYDNREADAKSLINVLALKVPHGARITIKAIGDDEALSIDEILSLIHSI